MKILDKPACPICGKENKEKKIIYKDQDSTLVECKNCGLIFNLSLSCVQSEHPGDFFIDGKTFSIDNYDKAEKARDELLGNYWIRHIQQYSHLRKGKILDIGCATGNFLRAALEKGWDTYGVEISDWACKRASKWGKIHHGILITANYPSGFFDVVRMGHVLLHMKNPLEDLVEVSRVLKPNGYLFIEEENASLLPLRFAFYGLIRRQRRVCNPSVIYYFNRRSLSNLLRTAGFKIESLEYESISSKQRTQYYLSDVAKNHLLIKIILRVLRLTSLDVKLSIALFLIISARPNKKQPFS